MRYDLAFRHQQALQPDALVTLTTTLHAIDAAVTDCRNAGGDVETDPAILLLARRLGEVATIGRKSEMELKRACIDQIAELQRRPALLVLSRRGVAYDAAAKRLFIADGRKALRRIADALLLADDSYEIRANPGGLAVSGEITLHGEELWVQLSLDCRSPDLEVIYRRVQGRRDLRGDRNRWTSVRELLAPDRFAARLRRELGLSAPPADPIRLFA